MGTPTLPTLLRGLLVPDPRFRSTASVTATTQAGPRPGVPEPQSNTELVLEAVGEQNVATPLHIQTNRGGHPGTDSATFVWKFETDGSDDWRGWDPPVSLTGFEFLERATSANKWARPHAVSIDNGWILVSVWKDQRQTVVWRRDPADGTWSEVEVYDPGATFSTGEAHPCLVVLPSGRVLCFFWHESSAGHQIRSYYSDDLGATWSAAQKGCLDQAMLTAAYLPGRLRAAYIGGQIALFAHIRDLSGPEDQVWHYASNDLGATLDLVSTLTGTDRAYPDVVATGGRLVVAYVSATSSSGSSYPIWTRLLGSAYEPLEAAEATLGQYSTDPMEWGSQSAGVFDSGDMSLWVDDDGSVYAMGRDHSTGTFEVAVRRSVDGGESWRDVGTGPGAGYGASTWRGSDANTYPYDLAVCAWQGRGFLAHRCASSPATADDSLMGAWLGGYTTVCLPQQDGRSLRSEFVAGWAFTWLPYDLPENTGTVWTASSTGAASLSSLGLHLTTAVAQTEYRLANGLAGTNTEGLIALAEVRVESGTARVELRISDATPVEYEVAVLVTGTTITLWDLKAGSSVASVSTTDAAGKFVQVLVELQDNRAKAWFRPVTDSNDRKWTRIGQSFGLTSSAANNGHRVRFGQTDSTETYWRLVQVMHDRYTESKLFLQDNWTDLLGRSYMPSPVYVDVGLKVQAVDGPTFRGDIWHIAPLFDYGVANVFPDVAASPRREHRSESSTTAAAHDIEWAAGGTPTDLMGALGYLYIGNANFGTAELHGQDGAGTWHLIGNLDLRLATGLKWTRGDRMVRPDTSGGSKVDHILHEHILAGSYIALDDGGETKKVRPIETNSVGGWVPGSSSLQTRVLLEAVDGTEGTAGTAAELWSKDYVVVFPMATSYKRFRLRIPTQSTYEDYFRIGVLSFGHVYPIGGYLMGYGWGRKLEWAYDYEQVEGRTGIRTVRGLGPTRRASEVSWVDGVETSGLQESDPSWLLGWSAGEPVALPAALPWSLPGLLARLRGAVDPVVYLSAFDVPANGTELTHVTDRTRFLFGRVMTETVQGDVVVGDETESELIRVGVCRVEEEL